LHRKCRATQDKEPDVTQAIDEQDDDAPVGRILSRREVLGLLGGLGAVLRVGLQRQYGSDHDARPGVRTCRHPDTCRRDRRCYEHGPAR
jgi:hypothetical protein